jgi:hypothetical protein
MVTVRKKLGIGWSGGCTSREPMMPTGTIGASHRRARRATPVWPLWSLPVRLRVPSG